MLLLVELLRPLGGKCGAEVLMEMEDVDEDAECTG